MFIFPRYVSFSSLAPQPIDFLTAEDVSQHICLLHLHDCLRPATDGAEEEEGLNSWRGADSAGPTTSSMDQMHIQCLYISSVCLYLNIFICLCSWYLPIPPPPGNSCTLWVWVLEVMDIGPSCRSSKGTWMQIIWDEVLRPIVVSFVDHHNVSFLYPNALPRVAGLCTQLFSVGRPRLDICVTASHPEWHIPLTTILCPVVQMNAACIPQWSRCCAWSPCGLSLATWCSRQKVSIEIFAVGNY